MSVLISKILRRSVQGVTRPFLCESAGGGLYFVKGTAMGQDGLRAEWLAGCLGRFLGLPVPDFDQIEVPEALIKYSVVPGISDLLGGLGFGSALIADAQEMSFAQCGKIDWNVRARVLLFDWWIWNSDRTLSVQGGNPNLLCTGHEQPMLWVIDQHAAFESALEPDLWALHAFQSARALWTADFIAEMTPRLLLAAAQVPVFWSQMPDAWCPAGDSTSDASSLELSRVLAILNRVREAPEAFWSGVL